MKMISAHFNTWYVLILNKTYYKIFIDKLYFCLMIPYRLSIVYCLEVCSFYGQYYVPNFKFYLRVMNVYY